MQTYLTFLINNFFKSLLFVSSIILSLLIILNIISELDFFDKINVEPYFIIYLSLLNTPIFLFEIFPFIIIVSTQLFFINLSKNKELDIFKYSGLTNSRIISIIGLSTLIFSIFLLTIFYSFSSNLKNIYINLKKEYTNDGKYLAVITKNGLWIKDMVDKKNYIINAEKILINTLKIVHISEFDKNFQLIKHIKAPNVNIINKNWILENAEIFVNNERKDYEKFELQTNFNYKIIQNLYSDLTTLSILELLDLKQNYIRLNYSVTEINLELLKFMFLPIYMVLLVISASIISLNTKLFSSQIIKISFGLMFSVIIFYINNIFNVMGKTEKVNIIFASVIPLVILILFNLSFIKNINEK